MPLVRHPAVHWLIHVFFFTLIGRDTAGGGPSTERGVTRVTMATEGGVTLLHTIEGSRGVTQ